MLTEQEIREIITKEVIFLLIEEGLIDEGFLGDLGKKAGKLVAPLAMAAGLSGMPSTAAAAPGELTSVESPIIKSMEVEFATAHELAKMLKEKGIKDVTAQELNYIGKLGDRVFIHRGKKDSSIQSFRQSMANFLEVMIERDGKVEAIKKLQQFLIKRLPKRTTVTQVTMANHRLLVMNAANGIGAEIITDGDVEGAIDGFYKELIDAVKSGQLPKEVAIEINNVMKNKTGMGSKLAKINKILGLGK